jgi:hypothetical protein
LIEGRPRLAVPLRLSRMRNGVRGGWSVRRVIMGLRGVVRYVLGGGM